MAATGMTGLELQAEPFDADVLVGEEEDIRNDIPLAGGTQSLGLGKLVERLFFSRIIPAFC